MAAKFSDQAQLESKGTEPALSSHVMDEIIASRLTTLPNMPARPGDPHYVGQSTWDAETGMLDLNSGKFTQGEQSIKSSISDLATESTLITGAQTSGKTAAESILSGDTTGAEQSLTSTIKDLKGNYFNTEDRDDYQKALTDLQAGHTWQAEEDIAKAEKTLGNRATRVTDASTDLTTGLKDFNSGDFKKGEQYMSNAMHKLHPHQGIVKPGGTVDGGAPVALTSTGGTLDIPNPSSLYTA